VPSAALNNHLARADPGGHCEIYRIIDAGTVGLNIKQFVMHAPRIARKHRPGQFVIVRLTEEGARFPLTIKVVDPGADTITIAIQAVGKTISLLNCLETGDSILDIAGPPGTPSEISRYGTAVILAGSLGAAEALPTAHAHRYR
jgi:ferredoxin--NADP+ reductase